MQQLQIPPLGDGEVYIGAIGNQSGDVDHIVLLPGDNDDATWQEQMDWAKSIGGDLPNRIEQALLFANARDQFKSDWYWSNEQHGSGWAWCQYFYDGTQGGDQQSHKLRARAVRRFIPSRA